MVNGTLVVNQGALIQNVTPGRGIRR
jgi:hypothetical protein